MAKYQPVKKKIEKLDVHHNTRQEYFRSAVDPFTYDKLGHKYTLNVVAEDKDGYYYTNSDYVGSTVLDPNRMYHRMEPEADVIDKVIPKEVETNETESSDDTEENG